MKNSFIFRLLPHLKLVILSFFIMSLFICGVQAASNARYTGTYRDNGNMSFTLTVRETDTGRQWLSRTISCDNYDAERQSIGNLADGTNDTAMAIDAAHRTMSEAKSAGVCNCNAFAGESSIGTVHGLTYGHLSRGGDLFCLDSGKSYWAYRCRNGGGWVSHTFNAGEMGWSQDQLLDIARVVSLGADYKTTQNAIWQILGQAHEIDASGLIQQGRNLDNSSFVKHKLNFVGTPAETLNTEFIMTDTNSEFSSDKFSVGSVSNGISVTKSGNTTRNVITQPYPISKTVNINGSPTVVTGNQSGSVSGYLAGVGAAQSFAALGDYAGSVKSESWPNASYQAVFPTGSFSIQKVDSLDRNVTSSYCSTYGLCSTSDANPVDNTFRLLIDNSSQYWGTNADSGEAVVVNGTTYHVFIYNYESGAKTFKTDANGILSLSNILVGDYYLQEIGVDNRVFVAHPDRLLKFTVNKGQNTTGKFKNESLGRYDFQKKDTDGNIVNKNYCSTYKWCAVSSADPVNNTYRVLMDEATWVSIPGYFYAGETVTVDGTTYYVVQMPTNAAGSTGQKVWKTDDNGQISLRLPKGNYSLQELTTDGRIFTLRENDLTEFELKEGEVTNGEHRNENIGILDFEKLDSFEKRVYKDYCRVEKLCISEDADATNNHFRVLINDESEWWGYWNDTYAFGDTEEEVEVEGVTYHVYKVPEGSIEFVTDGTYGEVGKLYIHLPKGHWFLQETSVDENVFIVNEELVEFDIQPEVMNSEPKMKNINLFGDMELQKWDEFGNKGLLNTYNNDASGNSFRLKYIDTLGRDVFTGKEFNLPDGHVKVTEDKYLEIDDRSLFTTDSNGYFWVCQAFVSTKNLCVPFGNWQLEEVTVQNEFELNDHEGENPMDVIIEVGDKSHVEYANDYRRISVDLSKQDADDVVMVPGAKYTLYDIDKYNIGIDGKGATDINEMNSNTENQIAVHGEKHTATYENFVAQVRERINILTGNHHDFNGMDILYEGEDIKTEIFTSIDKNSTQNFYDDFVGEQDGVYPDYNYTYELETDNDDEKVPDTKYMELSENEETVTGKSSGLTEVKVYKQLKDLYGTVQDRYYYIGDHAFDPYENFEFWLDEDRTIPVNIREKSFKIYMQQTDTTETVVSANASLDAHNLDNITDDDFIGFTASSFVTPCDTEADPSCEPSTGGYENVALSDEFTAKLEELGITMDVTTVTEDEIQKIDKLVFTFTPENYEAQVAALTEYLNSHVIEGVDPIELEVATETETSSESGEVEKNSIEDIWDVEGVYRLEYTIIDDARHKWTFNRFVTYEDDHEHVCEYNAVKKQSVWGDTKEVCKTIDQETHEIRKAPEEYDYDTQTVTYDPTKLMHLVEGEKEKEYISSFMMWCVEKDPTLESGADNSGWQRHSVGNVDHYYKMGEYTTDENGKIVFENLIHSRTYMVCETGLPKGYTYPSNDNDNVCFIIDGNYVSGKNVHVNTKNNEIIEILISTTAQFKKEKTKEIEFDAGEHTITDRVQILGLDRNTDYHLVGKLMSKLDGNVVETVEYDFTSDSLYKKMIIDMDFKVFPKVNDNQEYVVFEYLYKADDLENPIAEHTDITDEGQTVKVTKREINISTVALIDGEKSKTFNFDEETVVDTVRYENIITGKPATMRASLIDLETNTVVATGETKFVPKTLNGTVDVELKFYQDKNVTKSYVVYEEYFVDALGYDYPIAEHKENDDEDQTVTLEERIVEIATTAMVEGDKTKEFDFKENTVVDTVEFKNAFVGKEATLKAELYDVEIGALVASGSTKFTPAEEDGTIDVELKFLQEDNLTKKYVVTEKMYLTLLGDKAEPITVHDDLTDVEQQIDILERKMLMHTIVSKKDIRILKAGEKINFEDKIMYENLVPGLTYKARGYLVNKKDAKPYTIKDKIVYGEMIWTPTEKNGEVNVPFEFDPAVSAADKMKDGEYVIFEEIYLVTLKDEIDEKTGEPTGKKVVDTEKLILEDKNLENTDETFKYVYEVPVAPEEKPKTDDYKPVPTSIGYMGSYYDKIKD